jgi:hypothetical protein
VLILIVDLLLLLSFSDNDDMQWFNMKIHVYYILPCVVFILAFIQRSKYCVHYNYKKHFRMPILADLKFLRHSLNKITTVFIFIYLHGSSKSCGESNHSSINQAI